MRYRDRPYWKEGIDLPLGCGGGALPLCLDCRYEMATPEEEERGYCLGCRKPCAICRKVEKVEDGSSEDGTFVCAGCIESLGLQEEV